MAYPKITVLNHMTYMKKRTAKIQYIILHYTGSTQSKNQAYADVQTLDERIKKDGTKGLSSDFVVDDINILQLASNIDEWRSTAVQSWNPKTGGTEAGRYASNDNSVSIEMCSTMDKGGDFRIANHKYWRFTDAVLQNTGYLCGLLIVKYNIPKSHIIRHYDIMGKPCPGLLGWNLGPGSPNDDEYRKYVDLIYNTYVPLATMRAAGQDAKNEEIFQNVEYNTNSSGSSTSGSSTKSSGNSSSTQSVSVPVSNKVTNLSDVGRIYANQITQLENNRKQAFISMQESLFKKENMGDKTHNINPFEIMIADNNLYDSNILKGDQEARKEIIGKDRRKV